MNPEAALNGAESACTCQRDTFQRATGILTSRQRERPTLVLFIWIFVEDQFRCKIL